MKLSIELCSTFSTFLEKQEMNINSTVFISNKAFDLIEGKIIKTVYVIK